jgi:hypothetical protein
VRELDPQLELDPFSPPGPRSVRLTVVQEDSAHPLLDTTGEDWLTTVPHLVLREVTAFCVLVAVPLLSYAWHLCSTSPTLRHPESPRRRGTSSGSRSCSLLPPFVSGILMPAFAILALLVIPCFDINIERRPPCQTFSSDIV